MIDIRLSNDIRTLIKEFPKAKFTTEDLKDIVTDNTIEVYKRLGAKKEVKKKQGNNNLVENKKKMVGADISKRTFSETPDDGLEWGKRIDKIATDLEMKDGYTNSELKEAIVKSDMTSADIKYLLANL